MATINKTRSVRTHEGAKARAFTPEQALKRALMNCMLWEDQFYEDGVAIGERIGALVPKVAPETVAAMAIEAREDMKLRHAPLLIVREMARHETHRGFVADTLERVIQRPDELTEFLAIYWADALGPMQQRKKAAVSAQAKKGLARAFAKFDAYQLAKYDRDGAVRLRDVLFITHAKPKDEAQEKVWKQLVDGALSPPDTWEVALSGGADKKAAFERLIADKKLGALALLRNLRNMQLAGVPKQTIGKALDEMRTDRVLPYRFIAAAQHAPDLEPELEHAMFRSIEGHAKLKGKTRLLVDVSGSMDSMISARSTMRRLDAACGLAVLAREIGEDVEVFTFSNHVKKVPSRRGFALRDAIVQSQPHMGTELGKAIREVDQKGVRLIVFTDEQSHDRVDAPKGVGYMVNVASYQHGVGEGDWRRVDGFSEKILDWIIASESA
ncbi:MAG TPA: TROVE domain-containing protein [Vitreimonas sp.]|uniref:TROVE domain-containing protein n=1 Tax=Vitreimonas sp. TaxID=3069702 RepID=UPI002D358A3C|nr:TROVE domain-containing protein [Vitreimonas sp.]HYD88431.1 TROVE domain-containing protein [Vitreimonas sp.]